MLTQWDNLPENMKKEAVKPYYEILKRRQVSIIGKRIMDVCLSAALTVFLSPAMAVIGFLIKAEDHGPVFYRQERITTNGKKFRIFKFRTMIVDADKKGPLLTGKSDDRITKMGHKLRRCRLDELPQLLNILAGDMSFVGTRPEVEKYVSCYSDEMMATLLLPAGVTSLSSVAFKDEDTLIAHYTAKGETVDEVYVNRVLPKKMKGNLSYLKRAGVLTDMKIMIKTVLEVLK